MKRLTFAEFFDQPEGVLFTQDFALPHQNNGLWIKGKSYQADGHDSAGIAIDDAVIPPEDDRYAEFVTEGSLEEDHRFLVYELTDLRRLWVLIEDQFGVAS